MGEILKLKVSPKGQITLPKKIRDNLSIRDYVYIEVKDDRAELKSVSLEDELEELMINDLKKEGYTEEQIKEILPEKKRALIEVLAKDLKERDKEESISHEEALKELGLD